MLNVVSYPNQIHVSHIPMLSVLAFSSVARTRSHCVRKQRCSKLFVVHVRLKVDPKILAILFLSSLLLPLPQTTSDWNWLHGEEVLHFHLKPDWNTPDSVTELNNVCCMNCTWSERSWRNPWNLSTFGAVLTGVPGVLTGIAPTTRIKEKAAGNHWTHRW